MTRRERNQSRKGTKRALTGSILAIVLCIVLLAGATFAWFTDTASTKVSKIESGKLKVELQYYDSTAEKYVSAEGQSLSFTNKDGSTDILWEPGATFTLPKIKVVNKGNLALKYKVVVSSIEGDEELANVLNVTLTDGTKDPQELGTLKALSEAEQKDIAENYLLAVEGKNETAELTLSVQMDKNAGNQYQDQTITGVTVSVVATQYTYESDSKDNQYDKDAEYPDVWDGKTVESNLPNTKTDAGWTNGEYHVTTAAQLVGLMNQSQTCQPGETHVYRNKTIILDKDIDLGGATVKGFGSFSAAFGGTFDGNGHTISNFKIDHTDSAYKDSISVSDSSMKKFYTGLFNNVGGTVKNLTVRNAIVTGEQMVGVIASNAEGGGKVLDCSVIDCTVNSTVKKAGAVIGYTASGTVTGCTATNCVVNCADSDAAESNEIVGYVNEGSTVKNNIATRVTVNRGVTF